MLSVIAKNRMRPLSMLEGFDVAFDYESVAGNNSERKLRMQTIDARSVDDYTSQASVHEPVGMLPQINTANRGQEGPSNEDPFKS